MTTTAPKRPMDHPPLKIAEAARLTGVSASTLRLWESQGLVEPIRTLSGQRLYDRHLLGRLQTIAWMRNEKGLNPAAIREEFAASDRTDATASIGAGPVALADEVPLGSKVRRLRRAQRKTLSDMATAAGVAVSLLSTFERTSQGISIATLHAVAGFLGTTVATLSGQAIGRSGTSLVRDRAWTALPTSSSGVTINALAEGRFQMECHRFDLAPGASSEGAYQHEGEEFIFVLLGRLEVVLDGDQFFELNAGDSFYFESARPHSWRNLSDGQTVLIWINTPPTF